MDTITFGLQPEELQTAREVDNDHDTFAVNDAKNQLVLRENHHIQAHVKSWTNGNSPPIHGKEVDLHRGNAGRFETNQLPHGCRQKFKSYSINK